MGSSSGDATRSLRPLMGSRRQTLGKLRETRCSLRCVPCTVALEFHRPTSTARLSSFVPGRRNYCCIVAIASSAQQESVTEGAPEMFECAWKRCWSRFFQTAPC